MRELEEGESDYLLMTTWHADESLEEALWFFQHLAIPAENHVLEDLDRFAVAIGNPEWNRKMERYLSEIAAPDAEAE
jgi:hypothetical protein